MHVSAVKEGKDNNNNGNLHSASIRHVVALI